MAWSSISSPSHSSTQESFSVNAPVVTGGPLPANLQKRLNPDPVIVRRESTGYVTLDEFFGGGLPAALTLFAGSAGSGKSMMARALARKAKLCLYFCSEVTSDSPRNNGETGALEYPNVYTVNYTQYKVKAQTALSDLFTFIACLQPSLVIIDSVSGFFSIGAMLPETQTRILLWELHQKCQGLVPIVALSELRGAGFNEHTAGGRGVEHANNMYVYFRSTVLRFKHESQRFGRRLGSHVWTVQAMKDKQARAKTDEMEVIYLPAPPLVGDPVVREIVPQEEEKPKWTGWTGAPSSAEPTGDSWLSGAQSKPVPASWA